MNQHLQTTIIRREIGGSDQRAVDARLLHGFLENGDHFAQWIKERIQQYGFVEGIDFVSYSVNAEKPKGGRPSTEYALTTDMAKELCMVERNAKGKEARLYFIEMERQAKDLAGMVPRSLPEALRMAAALEERNQAMVEQIKAMEPKVAFHDRVAAADGALSVRDSAKAMGTGQNRLFAILRGWGYLMKTDQNIPYQEFIDRGWFRVVEQTWPDKNGIWHMSPKTLITGKGQIHVAERLEAEGFVKPKASAL